MTIDEFREKYVGKNSVFRFGIDVFDKETGAYVGYIENPPKIEGEEIIIIPSHLVPH